MGSANVCGTTSGGETVHVNKNGATELTGFGLSVSITPGTTGLTTTPGRGVENTFVNVKVDKKGGS